MALMPLTALGVVKERASLSSPPTPSIAAAVAALSAAVAAVSVDV